MSFVLVAASLSSWAPMFSYGSSSSISLATVTPSWVMVGEPNFRSRATLRPLGPSVVATAVARMSTPAFSRRRASSEKASCLAAIFKLLLFSRNHRGCGCDPADLLGQDGQNIALSQDQQLLAVDLDLGSGVLGEKNFVARL